MGSNCHRCLQGFGSQIAARYRSTESPVACIHKVLRGGQRDLLHDLDYSFILRILFREDQTLGRPSAGMPAAVRSGAIEEYCEALHQCRVRRRREHSRRLVGSSARKWLRDTFPGTRDRQKVRADGIYKAVLPKSRFRQLREDTLTIDFSGWSLVTHRWLPNPVAYAAMETIDERKKMIPVDDDEPLNVRNLCRSTEKCSLQIPLHPGALKYYKEKGYL